MSSENKLPLLPEPDLGYIETDKSRQPAFSARQMRAALQAQPAEVSDDLVRETIKAIQDPDTVNAFHNGYYTLTPEELRRAILALRPQAEIDVRNTPFGKEAEKLAADYLALMSECAGLREQLASLRPQAVPMTDEQRALIIGRAADKTADRSAAALYAICETERLYGITAKAEGAKP